jgi:hypothetical protein
MFEIVALAVVLLRPTVRTRAELVAKNLVLRE